MFVEELKNKTEWDTFLGASPDGTLYHSLKWKDVIQKTFRISPLYLTIRDENGMIVGVCPGFIKNSIHFKAFDSLPYSDYGGPVIDRKSITRGSLSLLSFFGSVGVSKGINLARLRLIEGRFEGFFKSPFGCVEKSLGTMEVSLKATPSDFIWTKKLSRNFRNRIGKIERKGFQAQEARTKSDLRDFYNLYYKNMKHIGASPYPYSLFENMWTILYPENLRVWLVEKEKRVAGIAVLKDWQKTFEIFVGVNRSKEYSTYDFHPFMRWKEIKKAEEEGSKCVSFGSTPSNPENKHYQDKARYGSSFYQQEIVSYPLSSVGRILLTSRAKTISVWEKSKRFLPDGLTRVLRREVSKF